MAEPWQIDPADDGIEVRVINRECGLHEEAWRYRIRVDWDRIEREQNG